MTPAALVTLKAVLKMMHSNCLSSIMFQRLKKTQNHIQETFQVTLFNN